MLQLKVSGACGVIRLQTSVRLADSSAPGQIGETYVLANQRYYLSEQLQPDTEYLFHVWFVQISAFDQQIKERNLKGRNKWRRRPKRGGFVSNFSTSRQIDVFLASFGLYGAVF